MSKTARLKLAAVHAVALAMTTAAIGCTSVTKPPSVAEIEGIETCKAARDPLNPYVVEWRGAELTNLEDASNQGLVVVSYAGCTLKVLTGCRSAGGYEFRPTTPNRDSVRIDSKDKLYAELPLGAVNLAAQVEGGRDLELDYVAVGVRGTGGPPQELEGECQGATHYVRSITVGAFTLKASSREKAGGRVAVAKVGEAGGEHEASETVLKKGADVAACSNEPDPARCAAILRLGLARLPRAAAGFEAAGFGEGIDALADTPAMGELHAPELGVSFAAADPELLKKLELAKRAERNPALEPLEKAAAWKHLADHAGGAAGARRAAAARYDEWMRVEKAARGRAIKVEKIWRQWRDDWEKLEKLLALDDDVVSPAQKEAFIAEFDAAYTPYVAVIAEYEIREGRGETIVADGLKEPPAAPDPTVEPAPAAAPEPKPPETSGPFVVSAADADRPNVDVVLRNTTASPVMVTFDGAPHELAPGEAKTLEVTPGKHTFVHGGATHEIVLDKGKRYDWQPPPPPKESF
jgi:hypothetical protein